MFKQAVFCYHDNYSNHRERTEALIDFDFIRQLIIRNRSVKIKFNGTTSVPKSDFLFVSSVILESTTQSTLLCAEAS